MNIGRKKILITGSNGLLGQKIIYALLRRNDVEIIATASGPNRMKVTQGYVYEEMDITNEKQVQDVLTRHRPDSIINTAAMTNVDACETEKETCRKINVTGAQNLISHISNLKSHFIHLSTDFIFDGLNGPYKEDDPANPLSYYAWSKLESEKIIRASGADWAILRTIIIYGIADNMSRTNIVLWAKDSLEKGQPINVVDDQFRAPTLAEDLADACIAAAMKRAKGVYHVAGKDIMSILELVRTVADFFGLDSSLINPIKTSSLNQPAKRPPRTGFILDKAIRELNYHPHSFKEGLSLVAEQLKYSK
jgi:dTDP-4-dehydrorhamnose reductase